MPLVLWLNRRPGCNPSTGLLTELGPCRVATLNSWNNYATVIFLDQPVNVGYSYANDGTTMSTSPVVGRPLSCWILLSAISLRCVWHTTVCVHIPPSFLRLIARLFPWLSRTISTKSYWIQNVRDNRAGFTKVTSSRAFEPFLSTHTQGRLQISTYSMKPSSVTGTAGWTVFDLINAGNPCFCFWWDTYAGSINVGRCNSFYTRFAEFKCCQSRT